MAFHAVAKRIVVIFIVGIIRNEFVGWTYFAVKVIHLFILVATSTANNAGFCVGHVFVTKLFANFAVAGGNMFRGVCCLVEKELARGTRFTGCGRGFTAVLILASVANGTECGAIDVFTAKGAKFAIVWRVVLRDVGCLVEKELTGWTRFTG